jgi:hypothetical protein
MPRVLQKLRIDEISCVDRAANGGAKILLYKRDTSGDRERVGFYQRLFRNVGKKHCAARHPPRMRAHDVHSTRAEALRALLFSPDGNALMRAGPDTDIATLAEHLVESGAAARRAATKRNSEVTDMDLIAVCKGINVGDVTPPTEHELTEHIQKLANTERRQGETSAQAFDRVLNGDDERGLVLRKAIRVAKRANGFPV